MKTIREFISGFIAYLNFRRGLRVAESMFDDTIADFAEKHVGEVAAGRAYVRNLFLLDALKTGKKTIELPDPVFPNRTIRYHLGGPVRRLVSRVRLWWRMRKYERGNPCA